MPLHRISECDLQTFICWVIIIRLQVESYFYLSFKLWKGSFTGRFEYLCWNKDGYTQTFKSTASFSSRKVSFWLVVSILTVSSYIFLFCSRHWILAVFFLQPTLDIGSFIFVADIGYWQFSFCSRHWILAVFFLQPTLDIGSFIFK